ncbi:MAG: replicative DNA helicase [Clostridiales bacterium]|nr:replicative DNA helicase [Clostridiales bacterium]
MAKKDLGYMPHSLEAEQALLSCLLMDTRIQVEVSAFLREEDFFAESHKNIFHAMLDIIKNNLPVDMVTLIDALEKLGTLKDAGGISYITELTKVIPSSANYQRYLDIVTRDSLLRRLIKGSAEIIGECQVSQDKNSALAFAEKTVYDISNTTDTSEMVKINNIIPEVMTKFDELSKNKSSYKGIKTEFKRIDNLLNGIHNSDLMILAARPAVGKTSFAMNIVENVALQGYTCAVFSLEMSKDQLVQRMMCSVAGVSMENATKGKMNKTEWLKIAQAREKLSSAKIFIDDSAMITPQQVLSKCRRLKSKHGLDLVMIDYIQLMSSEKSSKSDNRQQEISEISRNLKILAKEVNVPVLALSQLSRAVESRKGRPQLADLRESGAIEQDADIVMFIHRPDKNATEKEIAEGKVQKNVAEIIIEKHRNGPTGVVKLFFKGECTKFLNLNEETGEIDGDDSQRKVDANVSGYEVLPQNESEDYSYNADNSDYIPQDSDVPPEDDFNPQVSSVDDEIF